MIKILISDFSRTILFPKDLTAIHEMNTINREKIAHGLGKDPKDLTEAELKQGGIYYRADEVFVFNLPLLNIYRRLKENSVILQIFTSGFVQNHSDLENELKIFDKIFNVEQNGGYKKIDPAAYENIFNNLKKDYPDLQPTEILFVDDESSNIEAARVGGLSTYLFPKYNSELTQEQFLENAAKDFERSKEVANLIS
jgi:FMN phosphatase YigB (HAD superfamily)